MQKLLAIASSGLIVALLGLAACGTVDTGECTIGGDGCGANASCVDQDGAAICACNTGFTGDGQTCADVDECAASTHDCASMASCTNTSGGYTCACASGYMGDGTTGGTGCTDIDECTNPAACGSNATCTNSTGSYQCDCNTGYAGDGQTCTLVDCGGLTPPSNGTVTTPNGTTYGQMATYACNPLYTLTGTGTRTCLATGQWSGVAPTCSACTTQTVTLTAVQSLSVNYPIGGTYNDNLVRAYENPASTGCAGGGSCDITGWIGFNLAVIPDSAVIQGLSLRAYATTVTSNPTVRVQYSTINNWNRSTSGTSFPRSIVQVSSPVGQTLNVYNTHTINVSTIGAANLANDLTDNWITLGVNNSQNTYSYAYYTGSDAGGNQPTLAVTFCN